MDECSLVALTRGAKGASIYREGKAFEFGVLALKPDEENDGDVTSDKAGAEIQCGMKSRGADPSSPNAKQR
jgi:hypothetical protein